jgi:hypothetical protein
MTIFAATSNDAGPAFLVAALAASLLGILVGSFVHAGLILLACKLTRVRGIRFSRAWTTALLCDVVFYGFLAVVVVGTYMGYLEERQVRPISYLFLLSPVNFVYLFAAAVLGHAVIFSPCLAERGQPPIGFGRAAAVATVFLGLSALLSVFLFILAAIVRAMVAVR